jgi:hypothetical protein
MCRKQREHQRKQQELQVLLLVRERRSELEAKDREWLRVQQQVRRRELAVLQRSIYLCFDARARARVCGCVDGEG